MSEFVLTLLVIVCFISLICNLLGGGVSCFEGQISGGCVASFFAFVSYLIIVGLGEVQLKLDECELKKL